MERRNFIGIVVGGVVAIAHRVLAQPHSVKRLAALMLYTQTDPQNGQYVDALEGGLAAHGWKVGSNLEIDYRWGIYDDAHAASAAAELVKLKPDAIFADSVPATRAAEAATKSIPIIFIAVSEPVSYGFVKSLAHPGGNVTGFSNLEPSIGTKWLETLKEMVPGLESVGFLYNPASSPNVTPLFRRSVEAGAQKFGVGVVDLPVKSPAEIESAMTDFAKDGRRNAMITPPDVFISFYRAQVIELSIRLRLPVIYPLPFYADDGGLAAYGPDVINEVREATQYLDRTLRGENPGDLPVQQPTKFQLVINLTTAKALGLEIPPTLLATADKVIE